MTAGQKMKLEQGDIRWSSSVNSLSSFCVQIEAATAALLTSHIQPSNRRGFQSSSVIGIL